MSEPARNAAVERRVLVVEDEPYICELLSDALESEGFEARCVQTDRDAYDALRREAGFGCMVVDVNLGWGATGFDVARFARSIDPALPVIYVSGQTSEASVRANAVTGSLFVPKPFRPDELLDQVRKLFGDNDDEQG